MEVKRIAPGYVKDVNGTLYTATGNGGLYQDESTGEIFVVSVIKNGEPVEIFPAGSVCRTFYDIEQQCIVHEWDLLYQFASLKAEQPEEYDYDFSEYLRNCTGKNGTLDYLED